MKADVYTGFLTEKVKVYPTNKKSKPREIAGKAIRRAFPLLMASVISLSGSFSMRASSLDDSKDKVENTNRRVSKVNEKKRERLPEKYITDLMATPTPPDLHDVNFNHLPENQDNFWEIVRNGLHIINTKVACSRRLSREQKAEYRITAFKMLSQTSRIVGTIDEVDLEDFNTLKSFLFFEKVVQHKDKYGKVLGKSDGVIDERSEFLGRYYKDQLQLKKKMSVSSGIQKFAKALYACDERFVLSYNDSVAANAISRDYLADWLKKQDIKDKNLWYFVDVDEYDYSNALAVYNERGDNWQIVLGVDPKGDLGNGFYSPVGSVLIHELQHLGQQRPSSRETSQDNHKKDDEVQVNKVYYDDYFKELGPNLYSLAIEDQMYKKVHGIKADVVLNYGNIDLGTHKVSIGQTAVWFSKMMKKYPYLSVDKLVLEPEVFNYLNTLGNGSNMHLMQKARRGME